MRRGSVLLWIGLTGCASLFGPPTLTMDYGEVVKLALRVAYVYGAVESALQPACEGEKPALPAQTCDAAKAFRDQMKIVHEKFEAKLAAPGGQLDAADLNKAIDLIGKLNLGTLLKVPIK